MKILLTITAVLVAIISTTLYRAEYRDLNNASNYWFSEDRCISYKIDSYLNKNLFHLSEGVRAVVIGAVIMSFLETINIFFVLIVAVIGAIFGLYACSTVWEVDIRE